MLKILFISDEEPFSFNTTGAAALKSSHLVALSKLENIELIIYDFATSKFIQSDYISEILPYLNGTTVKLDSREIFQNSEIKSLYYILFNYLFSTSRLTKEKLLFSKVSNSNIDKLQEIVNKVNPDVIWVEHLELAILTSHLKYSCKIIYSHHDFIYKLFLIRRKKLKDYINFYLHKAAQEAFIKKCVKYVITGSTHELSQIKMLNPAVITYYQPTIYPPISINWNQETESKVLRIVHLGSLRATANKIGLLNLLKYVIPELVGKIDFECWIVGDITNSGSEITRLISKPYITCTGYVKNLSPLLRPGDIHTLTYDFSTGTRNVVDLRILRVFCKSYSIFLEPCVFEDFFCLV